MPNNCSTEVSSQMSLSFLGVGVGVEETRLPSMSAGTQDQLNGPKPIIAKKNSGLSSYSIWSSNFREKYTIAELVIEHNPPQ